MKRILIAVVVLFLVGAGALALAIWNATAPTSGARIEAGRKGKALILVDLQEDYTGPQAKQPYKDADELLSAANQLIAAAHTGGWRIYLVRVVMPNDWFHGMMTGFTALAGTKGAEFDARLVRTADVVEIIKTKSDSFSNPQLDAALAANRVGEVYIAGLDAKFCVKKTIGGALNRGYAVNVVREGIATRHATRIEEHVQTMKPAERG